MPLLSDRKEKRNKFVFEMLDLDKDGKLNILNVLQLWKQVPLKSRLRKEIYKLLQEYKNKNILMKNGFKHLLRNVGRSLGMRKLYRKTLKKVLW